MSAKAPKPQKHPNNIRKIIQQSPWKLYQVAEKMQIPQGTLIDYCAGEYPLPSDRLQVLAEFLDCVPEYLAPPLPNVRKAYALGDESEETKDLEALLVLRTHCQTHPTDENGLQQLLELLGKVGRYREIEQCYERFRKELKKEDFWRKPDAYTTELLTQLRAQQAAAPKSGEQASQTNEVVSLETAPSEPESFVSPEYDRPLPPISSKPIFAGITLETLLWLIITHPSQFQAFVQQLQNSTQKGIPQPIVEASPYLVDTSPQKEGSSPSSYIPIEGTIEEDTGLERGNSMDKQRRETLGLLQRLGLVAATTGIPVTGHQNFIAEARGVLYPSGPGDKELQDLEQEITFYWQARQNVTIAPTDLLLNVVGYAQEVMTLLKCSLSPAIRTRLCACLSQGMLLVGVISYDAGQFQTARQYYQTAIDAAHEADHNILQALAWVWDSYSWMRSNETDRYEHAQESVSKACYYASLGSDPAVQCNAQEASAEVYAYLKKKDACIEALESLAKLAVCERGSWWYIHQFDISKVNGVRGICLQQFYRPSAPDTDSLLEDARQALETALSQPNVLALRRAFHVVDMAQVHARKGEVESACNRAKQIISIANTKVPIRQRLWTVRTLLVPYEDVTEVKDLDNEIRALLLLG